MATRRAPKAGTITHVGQRANAAKSARGESVVRVYRRRALACGVSTDRRASKIGEYRWLSARRESTRPNAGLSSDMRAITPPIRATFKEITASAKSLRSSGGKPAKSSCLSVARSRQWRPRAHPHSARRRCRARQAKMSSVRNGFLTKSSIPASSARVRYSEKRKQRA